ncbi:MAG: diaminobutyrate--2-oxoglutarate transaminase [Gammaproteobacteria bacterium]|nr:diaminobutyrate--2-oxoglutarate transaminase [Gammaproteobacteria bacterium]
MNTQPFERLESEVRSYCRSFPTVFTHSEGSHLTDEDGKRYLDFFAGAGVLNYGHNHPDFKKALIAYLEDGGIVHSLDMYSAAKRRFLETFDEVILQPRGMEYRVQFPGPTGTNAVESAFKLARKVTGRKNIVAFTNAFHGMTLGALAASTNAGKRAGAGVPLDNVHVVPFDGYPGAGDSLAYLEAVLDDKGSGVDKPAAIILETVQAEGGIRVAGFNWLKRLETIAHERNILLIVDDIQVGCGRTGPFFSFEPAGIRPDMITLSKSLSGFGLPFSLVLIQPEHDQWAPGEHNGTFRGHNPAFVTATAALEFWRDDSLEKATGKKAELVAERLEKIAAKHSDAIAEVRGRGLIQGLVFKENNMGNKVSAEAFQRGLIVETAGVGDEVLKLLPPLTTTEEEFETGLDIIAESVEAALAQHQREVA